MRERTRKPEKKKERERESERRPARFYAACGYIAKCAFNRATVASRQANEREGARRLGRGTPTWRRERERERERERKQKKTQRERESERRK